MEEAEAQALAAVFGARAIPAAGLKALVGERAVSGALTLAAAALARRRGRLFPFAGGALDRPSPALRPLTTSEGHPPGSTLVLLCGYAGNFGAIVLGD